MKLDTTQDHDVPTDDDRAKADADANAAFEQAFGNESTTSATGSSNAPADEPAAAPAPATTESASAPAAPAPSPAAAKPATNTEEHDDPFAGLHPKVRDMLGNHQKLAAQAGRVPGLTSRIDKMARELEQLRSERAAAPAPSPTPSAPTPAQVAIDQIRGELPEVADAIELALNQRETAAPKPAPAAPAAAEPTAGDDDDPVATAQATALREVHPDWDKTMVSNDFQLWLGTQAPEYQEKVQNTNMAVIVSAALTKFEGHQRDAAEAATRAQDGSTRQRTRLGGAQQVPGARTPPRQTGAYTSEEAAFEAGFKGT